MKNTTTQRSKRMKCGLVLTSITLTHMLSFIQVPHMWLVTVFLLLVTKTDTPPILQVMCKILNQNQWLFKIDDGDVIVSIFLNFSFLVRSSPWRLCWVRETRPTSVWHCWAKHFSASQWAITSGRRLTLLGWMVIKMPYLSKSPYIAFLQHCFTFCFWTGEVNREKYSRIREEYRVPFSMIRCRNAARC